MYNSVSPDKQVTTQTITALSTAAPTESSFLSPALPASRHVAALDPVAAVDAARPLQHLQRARHSRSACPGAYSPSPYASAETRRGAQAAVVVGLLFFSAQKNSKKNTTRNLLPQ